MAKKPKPFKPYAAANPASVVGGKFGRVLVLAPSFCGVRAVERLCHMPDLQLGVRERYIPISQLPHYKPLDESKFPLQSLLDELKEDMLLHGATPEAVMLVGAVSPFNEKELEAMAKKLSTKKAPAKKAPAKAAPKKDATEAKGRGRRSSLDEKASITATDKGTAKLEKVGKDDKLAIMVKAKTVGKALAAGVDSKDINYAARVGLISVG